MTKKDKIQAKIDKAKEANPHLQNINWGEILQREPDVLNNILGDVARSDTKRRSKIDRKTGTQKLQAMSGTDHSEREFRYAFASICGKESFRKTATKLNISAAHVYNLKEGKAQPTLELMEKIAEVYNRRPSYFLEYRVGMVLMSIESYLTRNPETATVWYSKVQSNSGIIIR